MWYWLKQNWIIVIVLVAVGPVSYIVSDQDSQARDQAQATQLVEGCKRTSKRAALNAYMNTDLAAARRVRGEEGLAQDSDALADAFRSTLPAPSGVPRTEALTEVVFLTVDGKRVARLTPSALALQAEGCEAAYR